MPTFQDILSNFNLTTDTSPYGNGHINDTYLAENKNYIIQKINTNVFKDPEGLMNNICSVTEFLKEKIIAEGGDPERETLTVIKTKDGKNYYVSKDGNCYRVYYFVKNSLTIELPENPEQLYRAAKGFALFQKRLADFDASTLTEPIKDFHNTPQRFKNLEKAIAEDKAGRASSVKNEIEFALAQKDWISTVEDGLCDGSIPLRVIHGDTKCNNILFDEKTKDALCVIDLDTVMAGSMLYDFGDALRIGASSSSEDEQDLNKVDFDLEYFEAFARGFAEECRGVLNQKEIDLLPLSVKLMTYECGIRFLTDYLEGDTYFKIHREGHNLDRARAHFKLVRAIDEKTPKMKGIIEKIMK